MSIKKKLIKKTYQIISGSSFLLKCYNRLNNKIKACDGANINGMLKKTTVEIKRKGNTLDIHSGCRLQNCKIMVLGINNRIVIEENCILNNVEIWIDDDNNEVVIGKNSIFAGNLQLACIEGRKIHIGHDCIFSSNIIVRTGDSHSIVDNEGNRINPSKDVVIGNHVWVGNSAIIVKGVEIADDCIVGTGSVVTRRFHEKGCIVAGNPAKVIKTGTSWLIERI